MKQGSQSFKPQIDMTVNRVKWVKGINLLQPTGHVMYQQFNIQQLYALPTLYLCVLYLFGNKQRLVPLITKTGFYRVDKKCLQRGTDWVFK